MQWQQARNTILADLARRARLGIITDMDGTISPIVPIPTAARPTARSKQLLADLHERLPLVAVISGRAAADVQARVGLPDLIYVGNHGLERWADGKVALIPEAAPYRPQVDAAARAAADHIIDGMFIEDKGATLSIHYRGAADPIRTAIDLAPVFEGIAEAHGLRMFRGRMVFELRPPIEVNKGTAFAQLVDEYRLDGALFLGDDTTDADAMHIARQLRAEGRCDAWGVGVADEDTPDAIYESADLLVAGVTGVEDLLAWLLSAVSASAT